MRVSTPQKRKFFSKRDILFEFGRFMLFLFMIIVLAVIIAMFGPESPDLKYPTPNRGEGI